MLFVEDDQSVAQMYKLKLELEGYRVDVATDGEMGVEMARREPPDIIFLDMRLPKLDGIGVLQALRSNPKPKTCASSSCRTTSRESSASDSQSWGCSTT